MKLDLVGFLLKRLVAVFSLVPLLLIAAVPGAPAQERPITDVIRQSAGGAGCSYQTMEAGGLERSYFLRVSAAHDSGKAVPLLLVFHGGFGNGARAAEMTQFNPIADRENFIVAYPNGVDHHWNDGRGGGLTLVESANDVSFVRLLIDKLSRQYKIDPQRIYATGLSNGAIFSYRLAAELSDKIAAIASVAGSMGGELAAHFAPSYPVSVLEIHGSDDRLVLFDGGKIAMGRVNGTTISVDQSLKAWINFDGCNPVPACQNFPDRDPSDGATARICRYLNGRNGTAVALIKINGGGHSWPNEPRNLIHLPLAGNICRDFDASEEIWAFFKTHPKMM